MSANRVVTVLRSPWFLFRTLLQRIESPGSATVDLFLLSLGGRNRPAEFKSELRPTWAGARDCSEDEDLRYKRIQSIAKIQE
jgi:hypothetical protein